MYEPFVNHARAAEYAAAQKAIDDAWDIERRKRMEAGELVTRTRQAWAAGLSKEARAHRISVLEFELAGTCANRDEKRLELHTLRFAQSAANLAGTDAALLKMQREPIGLNSENHSTKAEAA